MMSSGWISQMRETARQLACQSGLYNLSLRGHVPEDLLIRPPDLWPGSADRGRWLCANGYNWQDHVPAMHSFECLRDLRAVGGDEARSMARSLIQSWLEHFSQWDAQAWRADLTGERIGNWLCLYEFYGASADETFQARLRDGLMRQGRHLYKTGAGSCIGVSAFSAYKGLLLAGLALPGCESWIEPALAKFKTEADRQILSDGGHITRSPEQLQKVMQTFLEVKSALCVARYPLPAFIQHAIDRMGQVMRFFRYPDKGFALFHSSRRGDRALLNAIFSHAQIRGKTLQELPETGFQRLSQGRTALLMDCGGPPLPPFDRHAHASPLAFEMIYGNDRVFVSCGTYNRDPAFREALRGTAAHNTLTVDHRNASEISETGHFSKRRYHVVTSRNEAKGAILIDASHDGYVPAHGFSHRRRLYMSDKGNDIRGEDTVSCHTGLTQAHEYAVRFHIHPRVLVSLVREDTEALLRLPNGIGWRFHHAGGKLGLENSIYCEDGHEIRKTKQLVISGQITEEILKIKWSLRREG